MLIKCVAGSAHPSYNCIIADPDAEHLNVTPLTQLFSAESAPLPERRSSWISSLTTR
jgi:hypothetical protein